MTVLRLQNSTGSALKNGIDWFVSSAYTTNEIVTISDPDGGKGSEPTSIPSPFARMDVIRTAYKYVNEGAELNTTFYKIVSDCLDIAEIFFLQNQYSRDIKIYEWDKKLGIDKLQAPESSSEHKILGDTLQMYLDQDAASFNFNVCDKLYLLEYRHKIIGGTSPVTLFFTTANDLSGVDINFPNGDKAFDPNVCPLYDRSENFQLMLYSMRMFFPGFARYFRDLSKYMDNCLDKLNDLNQKLYSQIYQLTGSEYSNSNYDVIGNGIFLLHGLPLLSSKLSYDNPGSDFEIKSSKYVGPMKPLVLAKGHKGLTSVGKPMRYYSANYLENTPVEHFDNETDLNKRYLPGLTGIKYPYLTMNDFLEPTLIRTVFPLNKENYFDGNYDRGLFKENKGFLLPLKRLFFTFFGVSDLLKPLPDGKNMIDIESLATGNSIVTLRIPIKNGEYIVYKREYKLPGESFVNLNDKRRNEGLIQEHQFGITIFPFIKTKITGVDDFYRIQLVDRNIVGELKHFEYQLSFLNDDTEASIVPNVSKIRSDKNLHSASSKYFILTNEFDFIQLQSGTASGIIIPKWPVYIRGSKEFKFSIDFGTSYTHIEYCDNTDSTPRPFDISKDDEVQIAHLFDNNKTSDDFSGSGAIAIREMINEEFLPLKIGSNNSDYRFPLRTVLAESGRIDINSETDTLADFNIPFIFEKQIFKYNNSFQTNLKWAKQEPGNFKRVKSFFESLIFMIRTKVLLNHGNLEATKIIWFYPTSMKSGRKDDLEKLWNKLVQKYIKPVNPPVGIAESLAPFYYYKYKNAIPGGNLTPALSIDIGGATTDIVLFIQNKPQLLSSFKFAANSIFGDGYSPIGNIEKGFVKKYLPHFDNILQTFKGPLKGVLDSLTDHNKSEDINTFLFSLESNSKVVDKDLFSYNNLLSNDEDMKIIFVYFYAAIIYHSARLINHKDIGLPGHIFFSGTGSKTLGIICSSISKLEKFTTVIFEHVFSKKYTSGGIKLIVDMKKPKETSCKGGLMCNAADLSLDIRGIKSFMTFTEENSTQKLNYNQIDTSIKSKTLEEVFNFNSLFLSLISQTDYKDDFKISNESYKIFLDNCNQNLDEYLEDGIEFKKQLDNDPNGDKELEETLFFTPLIGSMNEIIDKLSSLTAVIN